MTRKLLTFGVLMRLVVPLTTTAAQEGAHRPYPNYRVIDPGTLGGPNSHVILRARALNNAGELTVSSDTPDTDPYSPDGFNGGCKVTHTARWKKEELNDLGVVTAGPNSETNWITENGLIAGDSRNGLTDPLVGFSEMPGVAWTHDRLVEVGTLGGGYNSLAGAANYSGEVVGFSTTFIPETGVP